MPEPIVQKTITLGNILSMGTTAISVVGVIVAVTLSLGGTNKDVEALGRDLTAVKAGLEQARATMRQLEISEARTAERYTSIMNSQAKLEAQMGSIAALLQGQPIGRAP